MGSGKQTNRAVKVRIEDLADLHRCCAGIDVHKASVTVCVICGGDEAEVAQYGTTTNELKQLKAWLASKAVTHIVMESTGVYWKPVWQILEQGGFHLLLANARQVRNMPGRKTDQADAIWLATLLRKGLIEGSFIPPAEVRALRDLCRSRTSLLHDRTRIVQRLEKVLEEANIKLDTVVSDLMGISGQRMLEKIGRRHRSDRVGRSGVGQTAPQDSAVSGGAGRKFSAAPVVPVKRTAGTTRGTERAHATVRRKDRGICTPF
jgi:transposase